MEKSSGLRPTPDRVRETLFNWLAATIDGARCLDLFAGTGALGIEALSRGAAHVDFIERDRTLAAALIANLARLKQIGAHVRDVDALHLLESAPNLPYDMVFIDPPFDADLWTPCADALAQPGWLRAGAMIYVEAPVAKKLQLPSPWQLHRTGEAGTVRYALYRQSAKLGV